MIVCASFSYRLFRHKPRLFMHFHYIFFKLCSRKSTVTNRCNHLPERFYAHVSCRKKSFSGSHLRLIRNNVSSFVCISKPINKACFRGIACKYKYTEGIIFYLMCGLLSCYPVLPCNTSENSVTFNFYYFFIVKYGNVLI